MWGKKSDTGKKQQLQPRCGKMPDGDEFFGRAVRVNWRSGFSANYQNAQIPRTEIFCPPWVLCQGLRSITNVHRGGRLSSPRFMSMHPGTAVHYNIRGNPLLPCLGVGSSLTSSSAHHLSLPYNKLDNLLSRITNADEKTFKTFA